jgi:methylphosphotriester-DNA--protein-cysteine methyltransferase
MKRVEAGRADDSPSGTERADTLTALLHGCRSTHIYCLPTCRYDRRVLERNRMRFASAAEAVAAGYRACKVCKPPLPETSGAA